MPLGYYDAQIVVTSEATDHGTDVHVQIDAGVPTLVRELALGIDGAAQSDRQVQRVVSGFKPALGKRFVDARYEDSKRDIDRVLAERGYFHAELDRHRSEKRRVGKKCERTG